MAKPSGLFLRTRLGLLAATAAGLAVVLTLRDPGLTIDEPLDVRPGRTYVATLQAEGWRFFRPEVVERVFRDNAEHPPLGRWLLGLASSLGEPFEIMLLGADPTGLYVLSGRLAPALAFAVLVGAGGQPHRADAGVRAAGVGRRLGTAGHAPRVCPRPSGCPRYVPQPLLDGRPAGRSARHGGAAASPLRDPRRRAALWSPGAADQDPRLVSLPILAVWAFTGYRAACRSAAGDLEPWPEPGLLPGRLALALVRHLGALEGLLGNAVQRTTIMVQYFGQVCADRDVPWHYPWFISP